jgi:hypothetical protein
MSEVCSDLVSSADCKAIILAEMGLAAQYPEKHGVVFSQNHFIHQSLSVSLNKAFAVYDGRYLLMVSRLGLEMYDCRVDRGNYNNLLSFFRIAHNGMLEASNRRRFRAAHPHFKQLYSDDYRSEITEVFHSLRFRLMHWLRDKEASVGIQLKHPFDYRVFVKLRSRTYYWHYPAPCGVCVRELWMRVYQAVVRPVRWMRAQLRLMHARAATRN